MIRIGNQSAQSARNLWEPFDFAFANAFDAYEWFSDKKVHPNGGVSGFDETDLDGATRAGIRERAKQANMLQSVHAPWQANPLQLDGSELVLRSIDFAYDIGAALVNIHLYMSHGAAGFVSALRPLLKQARERGLALTIENTVHTTPGEFNEVFDLLKTQPEYDPRFCGMCLDIGHANLCSETHNDFIKYMDRLSAHVPILHVHAHENFGDADSHLPLFTGPAGKNDAGIRLFLERLKERAYKGAIILEQWPHPPQLLSDARARLRAMWSVIATQGEKPVVKAPDTVPAAPISSSTIPAVKPRAEAKPAKKEAKPEKIEKQEKSGSSASATVAAFEQVISSVPVPRRNALRAKPVAAAPVKAPPIDLSQVLDPFIRALVENHGKQKSWRGRLQWIRDRFTDAAFVPTRGDLATLAIYLRFLATGEAVCEEDGGHFRPNHHAEAAEQIEAGLARVMTRDNAWILRRIRPYLPSFAEDYRRAEPLTRIRDIAHRNDIPRELKEEIKKRLQNKLHRCAGPEDLRTSSEFLERFSAPNANLPKAFVDEFKIFHAELSAFFNATSLDERLTDLAPFLDGTDAATVDAFSQRKTGGTLDDALFVLSQALSVRGLCAAEGKTPLERARRAMADVGLEEFAFVQLSEIYNVLPQARFGEASGWLALIHSTIAALDNVRGSLIQMEECAAVASELRAWAAVFDATDRLHLLRLKASFERALRIASVFADESIALFQPRALELGRAIGVDPRAVQVFVEGDLRGSVVFQLSKIAEKGVQSLRHALDLPAWEAVVPGEANGILATAVSLSAFAPRTGQFIVALEHADGDEEIPPCVKGVVLAHSLPHLSHMCVRARQARVPFALTDERRQFEGVRKLAGRQVSLRVSAESVKVREAGRETVTMALQNIVTAIPQADQSRAGQVTPVEDAPASAIGGKASSVGLLRALAKESRGLFQVPRGVALPFGSMETVLQRTPSMLASYTELSRVISSNDGAPQMAAMGEIRGLIASLDVPGEWVEAVRNSFDPETRLAARSSANGEDLENLAGAGLYDSILNVRSETIPDAIRQVWSSIWTPRAVRSRAQCGIAHDTIRMAVLMQELIDADYAFIMHTTDTVAKDSAWATVELCAGLGETLASAGEPGAPYRLRCGRKTGEVRVEACASFSFGLRSAPQGGTIRERLDYSKVGLSADAAAVRHIGLRLAKLAEYLESSLGSPQDVEGVIHGGILCVVQSRPQQGL